MKTVVTAAIGRTTTTTVLIIPNTQILTHTHTQTHILHFHIIRRMEDNIILFSIPIPKMSMSEAVTTRGWFYWP